MSRLAEIISRLLPLSHSRTQSRPVVRCKGYGDRKIPKAKCLRSGPELFTAWYYNMITREATGFKPFKQMTFSRTRRPVGPALLSQDA